MTNIDNDRFFYIYELIIAKYVIPQVKILKLKTVSAINN